MEYIKFTHHAETASVIQRARVTSLILGVLNGYRINYALLMPEIVRRNLIFIRIGQIKICFTVVVLTDYAATPSFPGS
jgi:hypothetical protein